MIGLGLIGKLKKWRYLSVSMAEKDYSLDIKKIREFIMVMCMTGKVDADGAKYAQSCLNALDEIEKALKD